MTRLSLIVITLLFSASAIAIAPVDLPPEQLARFQALSQELRCLVCQNQNIADSNAELAQDLRSVVIEKIKAGQTDDEIRAFMTERYGDFVLYDPPLKPSTLLLWFGPAFLFLVGAVVIIRIVRQRAQQGPVLPVADNEESW